MSSRRRSFNVVGLGVAACAACCAVPIAGFIAATGLLTATGFALFGALGLVVAIPGIVLIMRRRAHPSTCEVPPEDQPVSVAAPSRRA